MSVSFALSSQSPSAPAVRFGLLPETLTSSAAATEVRTYGTAFFYTALLQNLPANTRFYYQIAGTVQVNSFVTARAPGDDSAFTVAVIGQRHRVIKRGLGSTTAVSRESPAMC